MSARAGNPDADALAQTVTWSLRAQLHLTVVCSAHANMLSSNYPDLPEEPQQPSGFPFPKRTFGCQTVVKCSFQPQSGFFCIITSLKIWCSITRVSIS